MKTIITITLIFTPLLLAGENELFTKVICEKPHLKTTEYYRGKTLLTEVIAKDNDSDGTREKYSQAFYFSEIPEGFNTRLALVVSWAYDDMEWSLEGFHWNQKIYLHDKNSDGTIDYVIVGNERFKRSDGYYFLPIEPKGDIIEGINQKEESKPIDPFKTQTAQPVETGN